jgi:hypothetical protein
MQEVCEAIKKTLPHILDEIEGLNISVAALHQQIKSMKTTLKILGKEHDVVHKVMVEQIFDLKNTLRYIEEALCYIT